MMPNPVAGMIPSLDAFNIMAAMAAQTNNPILMDHTANSPAAQANLLPFMSPLAVAAAAYYNNNNQSSSSSSSSLKQINEIVDNNSTNPNSYQRSYLDALRFYKAAYGSN
jgi:hypothetical protein